MRLAVIALTFSIALTIGGGIVLLSSDSSSSSELGLEGVSSEELKAGGVILETPRSDDQTFVTPEDAIEIAKGRHVPGAEVREVALARWRDDSGLREAQLVWVVSFEPDSVEGIPPFGPGPASEPVDPDTIEVVFSLVFVDAKSGEIVHGLEGSRGEPLKNADAPVFGSD